MEIEISLSEEQKRRMRSIFSFIDNYDENEVLKNILEASKEEYINQFLGEGNLSTISEIRQYKLFLLIKHVFKGMIPSEIEVASIFKIPISSASTLIRSTKSRYQFEIEHFFKFTIKAILAQIIDAEFENGYFHLYIRSSYMLSEMNRIIEITDPNCEKIKKWNTISAFYKITRASRDILQTYSN